jgi:radical SAM family RiPP maturation amino acid epimerase
MSTQTAPLHAPALDTVPAWRREIAPLLGDLSQVPDDHIRDVASIKRFLERWTMDPKFRAAAEDDLASAIAELGLDLRPDEILPLIDNPTAVEFVEAIKAGDTDGWPLSVLRYRAFYAEKRRHRSAIRDENQSTNPRIATWRRRQINRCVGELGVRKADAIVHAPAAIELSKGCTVGCWFCGVAAPRHDGDFPYDADNARLWRETLTALGDVMGPCAQLAFMYWATDPLDNPDYERFLVDFWEVLGRCPQTTTAQGPKDIERTRRLLRLSHSMDSSIDRFSIITLKSLHRIHAGLTAEEMLRVECVPQNREAGPQYRKSNAGRARKWQERREGEVMPHDNSSTIACVSGFLFNMVDRRVQLITPCNADQRWPLGYWVLGEGHFGDGDELRAVLDGLCREHMRTNLRLGDVVSLRKDLRVEVEDGEIRLHSRWIRTTFRNHPQPDELATMLDAGVHTAEEIALRREADAGVPLAETLFFLDDVFMRGLIDEEPQPPAEVHAATDGNREAARGAA